MEAASKPKIAAKDLQRWKLLERVIPLLKPLHEVGCERDTAGNRKLHFDDYVVLVLLYLFNPLIDSLQTLQKVSELEEVQKRLGIKRFSLGSFSESWLGKGAARKKGPLHINAEPAICLRKQSSRHCSLCSDLPAPASPSCPQSGQNSGRS